MPSNPRTRQHRFCGSKRHLQSHKKTVCQAALSRCGLQAPRRIRAKKAKKAKNRATLLYAGVYPQQYRFGGYLPSTYNGNIDKYLGTFDTQKQAAQAIAAVIGPAAGGGLHLRPQPVEQSGRLPRCDNAE
jgi:hypothetical protein